MILAVAFLFSTNRKADSNASICSGAWPYSSAFAFLVLKTGFRKAVSDCFGIAVNALLDYAEAGSQFLFGPLGAKSGPFGVVFAFQVLPIVIFIASLFAVLYQLGVMQVVVRAMAFAMQRIMGASGAESTSVAASIFMGQTEAPLTITSVSCRA